MSSPKLISIVAPCLNEEKNIEEFYQRISKAIIEKSHYRYEIIFIDNASTDNTVSLLRKLVNLDNRVKVIVNTRNFGPIRSPYWGILQASGDAIIAMASDLQDPPEMICNFIDYWEMGWKVVLGVKPGSKTNLTMHFLRRIYYKALDKISDVSLVRDTTGFGLYDKFVIDDIRRVGDPCPYFRGLVCELGYPIKTIPFIQPRRKNEVSKINFYSLYDQGMLGVVSHSIIPIRFASILGIAIGAISFIVGVFYLALKLIYWDSFSLGLAPLVISFFIFMGLIFFFLGLLGEYIGSIHMHIQKRPIVVEAERINF